MKGGSSSRFFGWLLNRGQFDFILRGKVLEVGCGKQRLSPHSVTLDHDSRIPADYHSDICKMPFADKEFDLVIAHEVFCIHPEEVQAAMLKEMERVARSVYIRQWKFCAWPKCSLKVGK